MGRAQLHHRNFFDFNFGANNNQPLCVESGQAAACGKSSEKRKGERTMPTRRGLVKRRRITTTMRKRIAPLLPPLLPLLLLPLPSLHAATPALPLLPLLKQWQQWRQQ